MARRDITQKRSFEKAFKAAVPNSEGKIWFKHPSKSYQARQVCFMLNGKEVTFEMYMNHDSIDLWKEHFNEFVETGVFDTNFYCQVYGSINESANKKIHKFPFTSLGSNKFYAHHPDGSKMLTEARELYGDCGLRTVAKPHRPRTKLVCTNCGSDNVQVRAWVNANTNEYISDCSDGEDEDNYCADCDGHHKLETVDK